MDEVEFGSHVRESYTEIPGLCVLDMCEQNIKLFHVSGDNSLILRDLRAVLDPAEVEVVVAAMGAAELEDAWRIRREMINFKKLCLHLFDDAKSTEKGLFSA